MQDSHPTLCRVKERLKATRSPVFLPVAWGLGPGAYFLGPVLVRPPPIAWPADTVPENRRPTFRED
jgi:hypothetical protein